MNQLVPRRRQSVVPRPFDELFWDPFQAFADFDRRMSAYVPSTDIAETDKEIIVSADVPGYDPQQIEVSMENGLLTISGKMQEESEDRNKRWRRRETASGNFQVQYSMPQGVDEDGVKCRTKYGRLTITIPKSAKSQKRTLQVEEG
jgi:HSP20 family protein